MTPDQTPPPNPEEPQLTVGERFKEWFLQEGAWWGASFVFHALLMVVLMLISKTVHTKVIDEAPSIEEAQLDKEVTPENLEKFEVGETPLDPTELNTETLSLNEAPKIESADVATVGTGAEMAATGTGAGAAGAAIGGLGGFDFKALGGGPAGSSKGVIGAFGSTGGGGGGTGFGGRSAGSRKAMVGSFGGTKHSERAVAAALNWIGRHQNRDGSWSINYASRCKDSTCSGAGSHKSDAGATALALLPFLAAGQTHETRGPYRNNIHSGLYWLLKNQKKNGDLTKGNEMYAHALCTITLCEAYGLTGDKMLGAAAQGAVGYIQSTQHPRTGGWRYAPGQEGDTSVVGWQAMALKSAQMATLTVNPPTLLGVKHWLDLAARGQHKGLYVYVPTNPDGSVAAPNRNMTAVGMLLRQYGGLKRDDPMHIEGVSFLMRNLPNPRARDFYYWYYATQVLHNVPGPEWDSWNRQMRRILIETQVKEGCATGSWDPYRPAKDPWAESAGRLFVTSLATLTLEVYYRYLPLYKLDAESTVSGDTKLVDPANTGMSKAETPAGLLDQTATKKAAEKKTDAKKSAEKKTDAGEKPKPAAKK
jgi:hypothetical protein